MSLDSLILSIRREFSRDEKYRLFLKHLDDIENNLREERKRTTDLLRENTELNKENKRMKELLKTQTAELSEYKATQPDKKFIRMSCYKKLEGEKADWVRRFWELHNELQQLKNDTTPQK